MTADSKVLHPEHLEFQGTSGSGATQHHESRRIGDVENPDVLAGSIEDDKPIPLSKVDELRKLHGLNKIVAEKRVATYIIFLQAFFHPFNILLIFIAVTSAVAATYDEDGDMITSIIIGVMIFVSSILRFFTEWRSEGAVRGLLKLVSKSVVVIRYDDQVEHKTKEYTIPAEQLLPGDWAILRPGDVIPADSIVIASKVFFVSQAPLTGEAIPVEKFPADEIAPSATNSHLEREIRKSEEAKQRRILEHKPMPKWMRWLRMVFGLKVKTTMHLDRDSYEMKEDLSSVDKVFMGCQVITGMGTVRVLRIGQHTLFGRMADALMKAQPMNPFQQGVRRISWIFFLTMTLMIPPVLLFQKYFVEESWLDSITFAIGVGVGLTPEMLPMIVNANLAKGSVKMAKKKSIIKKMDAVINMGAVDVICTDKTGTLTKSVIQLVNHVNAYGEESQFPIQLGFLNAHFQSVTENPLDNAIINYFVKGGSGGGDGEQSRRSLLNNAQDLVAFLNMFERLDELPFDFIRRRLSVLIREDGLEGKPVHLICKGAVEETLAICTKVIAEGANATDLADPFPRPSDVITLEPKFREHLMTDYDWYTGQAQRVLAVAFKTMPQNKTNVVYADETDMVFVGYLCFVDPPKESSREAISELMKHSVEVKVLTGDSPNICVSVCKEIRLPVKAIVTGDDVEVALDNGTLAKVVEDGTIFAKLTPLQKSLVVHVLKADLDHVVAFMGDGVNDAPAIKEADVGISVENGVDICRESADIILLDKDLNAVVTGVRVGRETYGNTIKYIAMTVSSNFGNVFSVLVASCWLPFQPMLSIQLLVQNLLYDISQVSIPWDAVDEEFMKVPHKWRMKSIMWFMVWMGPWSSVFDITTFLYMYYRHDIKDKEPKDNVRLFQTAWFTVGLLTQTLIVHMIRTPKIPLIQSRASIPLTIMTLIIMGCGLGLPYIPKLNESLQFNSHIPFEFYGFLAAVLTGYCIAANVAKFMYLKIFKEWF